MGRRCGIDNTGGTHRNLGPSNGRNALQDDTVQHVKYIRQVICACDYIANAKPRNAFHHVQPQPSETVLH